MNLPPASVALAVAVAVALAGCSKATDPTKMTAKQRMAMMKALTTPLGSAPTEQVAKILLHQQYDELASIGGLNLQLQTSETTVKQVRLAPKLHDVKLDSCKPVSIEARSYECSLTIKITLRDGDTPGQQGARLHLRQDDQGEWHNSR